MIRQVFGQTPGIWWEPRWTLWAGAGRQAHKKLQNMLPSMRALQGAIEIQNKSTGQGR